MKIFSDHILFFNPGTLPDNITFEQLANNDYVSTPRNKQVARLFEEMGEIERYGTGIKRVCDMFVDYGLGKPEWLQMNGGVGVRVSLVTENTTVKTVEKAVEKILAMIKENPKITQAELSELTGLSRRGIEWNISQLKKSGLITRIGPAKGGYWQVVEADETNK